MVGKVLLLIVFAYLVFYFTFDKVAPNKTASTMGYKTYNILSPSMKPVLNEGDLVVIIKHDFNALEEGDIVTFIDPHKNVVTHLFVRYENQTVQNSNGQSITEKVIRTKPLSDQDGNLTDSIDYWKINENNFIGKYSFKIAGMGSIVMFLQSWLGLVFIFLFISFIFVVRYLLKTMKKESIK